MADEAIVNVLSTLSKNISNSNDKLDSLTAMLKSQFTNLFASQLNFANNVSSSITKSKGTFGMATNKKAGPSIDTAAIISGMSSEITSSLDKLNETLEKNHLKILKEDEKRDKDREDNRKEDKQDEKKRVTGLNKDRGKTKKAQFKKSDGKYDDLIRKVLPSYGQKSGSAKFEQAVQSGKSRLAAVNIPQIQEKLNTTGTNLQKKGAAFERLQNLKSKGQAGLLGSGKTKRATGLGKVTGGLGGKLGGLLGKFLPMIGKFLPLISKALGPIGMLLPVILKVVGILDKFRDAVGFIITGGIAALGVAFFTVKAAIEKYLGPVIDAFKLVRKILIDSVIVALKAVGKGLMWLGETVWNVLKAPIMLLVDGLKLLGAGVKFIGEVAWEALKGTISAIVDGFKWLGQTIWSSITSIASLPGKLLGFVADIGSNLLSLPEKLWNWMFGGGDESTSITDTIYNIVDSLYQLPVKLLGFVTDMGVSLLQVPAKLFQFVTSMGKEVLSIPGKLVEFVSSIGKEFLAIPSKIFEWIFGKSENQSGIAKTLMQIAETILNIPGFIYEAATDALKFIVDIPAKIFDFVTGLQTQLLLIPSKLLQFISSIGQSIVSIPGRIFRWLFGDESSANEADGFISSLIKSIGSTLFELPGKLLSFVTNIGSSLLEVPKTIFNTITNIGAQLLEVPKMLFGFVTDLGKNIMAIPGKIFSWLFGGGDDNEEEVSNESGTIMKEAVQVVADALLSLPSKLLGFITEIGTSLLSIPAKIFQSINQMVMNIGATILSLPGKIFSWLFGDEAAANVGGFLKDVINRVAQALIEFPGKIVGFITDLGAQLLEVPKILFGFISDLGKNIMAIPGKIFSWLFGGGADNEDNEDGVSNESGTIMKEAVQVVADALLSLPGKLLTFITEIGTSLLSIPNKILESVTQVVTQVGEQVLSLPRKIFDMIFGTEGLELFGEGGFITNVIEEIGNTLRAIPGKLFNWLFGAEDGMSPSELIKETVINIGNDLLELPNRLGEFITQSGNKLLAFATELPGKIWDMAKSALSKLNPLKNLWPFGGDDEESVQDTSPLPIPEDRVKRVKTNEQLDELARIKQERIERLNALKFGNENPPLSPVNAPMPNTINRRELSPTDFPSGVINRNAPPSIKLESDEKLNKTLIDNNSQTNKLNQNMELLIDTIDKKDLSTKVYNNNQSAPVRRYSGGRHVRY